MRDSLRNGRPFGEARWTGLLAQRLGIDLDPRPRATRRGKRELTLFFPLGRVSLIGFLVIPNTGGAHRLVRGIVTFSNPQGTVKVSLRGTVTVYRGPFSFASGNLSYKVVSGTKADHGLKGTGPVLYGLGTVFRPDTFLLDFGNYPPPP